jgi:eukaryotic-like serine/threonine-protein kinase
MSRYEVLFPIAAGGMAEVLAARLRSEGGFEKLVALKRMHRHLAEDESFVRMFLDEGRLAANISSPNVVATLDLGRADDDALYIVLELVVGAALSVLMKGEGNAFRPIPLAIALEILAQTAAGLHDAHQATLPDGTPLGIVHRDVSPHNILVGTDGRVRISDFGVARAVTRLAATTEGRIKGKYAYFSPEQARGKPLDHRSDLFSLGIVAWEAIAGRRLFWSESPLETMDLLVSMPIPRLDQVVAGVPKLVADIVARALERDREARWATAGALSEALGEAAPSDARSTRDQLRRFVIDAGGAKLRRFQEQLKDARSEQPPGSRRSLVITAANSPSSLPTRALGVQRGIHPLDLPAQAPAGVDSLTTPAAREAEEDRTGEGVLRSAAILVADESAGAAGSRRKALAALAVLGVSATVGIAIWLGSTPTASSSAGPELAAQPATIQPASAERPAPAEAPSGTVPSASAPANAASAPSSITPSMPRGERRVSGRARDPVPVPPRLSAAPSVPPAGAARPTVLGVEAFDKHAGEKR